MLNHISITGRLVKDPEIINSEYPALHFIIENNHYNNVFYFDVYLKRNIAFYYDTLKKGYKVSIEGNLVQTKSRDKVVVLAAQVHIITIPYKYRLKSYPANLDCFDINEIDLNHK